MEKNQKKVCSNCNAVVAASHYARHRRTVKCIKAGGPVLPEKRCITCNQILKEEKKSVGTQTKSSSANMLIDCDANSKKRTNKRNDENDTVKRFKKQRDEKTGLNKSRNSKEYTEDSRKYCKLCDRYIERIRWKHHLRKYHPEKI